MAELPLPKIAMPTRASYKAYRRPPRSDEITTPSLVGKTLRIWISTLPQLLTVAALVDVPRFAMVWYAQTRSVSTTLARVADAVENLELLLIPALVGVFAVSFVFQRLRDEPADLGRSIALGFRRIGTALGIFVLFALPQIAMVFFEYPDGSVSSRGQPMRINALSSEAQLVLGMLMIVTSIVFALVFTAAVPASIVERIGVFHALRRSASLTSGRRSTILVANIVFGLLIGALAIPVFALSQFDHGSTGELLLTSASTWITSSLACVFPIVLYHELRRTKEGFGIDELAKAFD